MSDYPPLAFVTERPLNERPSSKARCPYCLGSHLTYKGASHTLLGGGDDTRDGDPNHWWEEHHCNDCGQTFLRETKSGQVWYTTGRGGGEVLSGFPNCFENYIYHHRCGGLVHRRYTALDGETPVTALTTVVADKKPIRKYRTFYDCEKCKASVEVGT